MSSAFQRPLPSARVCDFKLRWEENADPEALTRTLPFFGSVKASPVMEMESF